jgi:hypothetical protein
LDGSNSLIGLRLSLRTGSGMNAVSCDGFTIERRSNGANMEVLQREFYRSARGPLPTDEDVWRLIFDRTTAKLLVRHEWEGERHSGVDEFGIAEFLGQQGAAQAALLDIFFTEARADV